MLTNSLATQVPRHWTSQSLKTKSPVMSHDSYPHKKQQLRSATVLQIKDKACPDAAWAEVQSNAIASRVLLLPPRIVISVMMRHASHRGRRRRRRARVRLLHNITKGHESLCVTPQKYIFHLPLKQRHIPLSKNVRTANVRLSKTKLNEAKLSCVNLRYLNKRKPGSRRKRRT